MCPSTLVKTKALGQQWLAETPRTDTQTLASNLGPPLGIFAFLLFLDSSEILSFPEVKFF